MRALRFRNVLYGAMEPSKSHLTHMTTLKTIPATASRHLLPTSNAPLTEEEDQDTTEETVLLKSCIQRSSNSNPDLLYYAVHFFIFIASSSKHFHYFHKLVVRKKYVCVRN